MNVLLVNPNSGYQVQIESAPLGLLSIAAYLKERGFHVRMCDRKIGKNPLKKAVRGFQPDAVGISVAHMEDIHDGVRVSRWFRARGIPVIWGGQFSSLIPDMILREGGADYVVLGEGEITFCELLRAIERKSEAAQVKGVAYLELPGAVRRTPAREFADLADFPVTDWSFINLREYFFSDLVVGRRKMLCLYSSKGCPGNCTFCYNKDFHHSKCRKRPDGHVIREIEQLVTEYGMDGIIFVDDDMFGADRSDVRGFCERLRDSDLNVLWRCYSQLSRLSREDFRLMYDAGCRRIFCGIESGSPETLRRIRKNINLAAMESAVQNCHEAGILTHCAFIIGFPDETEEQLRDTVRLMQRLDSDMNSTHILAYFPIPCSEAYIHLVDTGQLLPPRTLREWSRYKVRENMINNFSNVPTRDLRVVWAYFYWRTFSRKTNKEGVGRHENARFGIISSLRNILRKSFINMCGCLLSSAKLFLTIVWYAHAYPGVRKKYGLFDGHI